MPYRRLPNTDKARLKALKQAHEKMKQLPIEKLPVDITTYKEVQHMLPVFEIAITEYNTALSKQKKLREIYQKEQKLLKMYVSHFLQVMIMAVERKDLPPQTLTLFNIKKKILPKFQTDKNLEYWTEHIISVENERKIQGLKPVENPNIISVNIQWERFKSVKENYLNAKRFTANKRQVISKLRPKVDNLIRKMWNQIEKYFASYPSIIKREKTKEYGIVYIFRKNEEKITLQDILNF